MTFYEKSIVNEVCLAFTRWNGWGPPASEYSIIEFCKAKASNKPEAKKFTEILIGWMNGEYHFDNPLWVRDD